MEMEQNGKSNNGKRRNISKNEFHIMQEIVRDVPKEYRNIFTEIYKLML